VNTKCHSSQSIKVVAAFFATTLFALTACEFTPGEDIQPPIGGIAWAMNLAEEAIEQEYGSGCYLIHIEVAKVDNNGILKNKPVDNDDDYWYLAYTNGVNTGARADVFPSGSVTLRNLYGYDYEPFPHLYNDYDVRQWLAKISDAYRQESNREDDVWYSMRLTASYYYSYIYLELYDNNEKSLARGYFDISKMEVIYIDIY
jgi:hypothetical protein